MDNDLDIAWLVSHANPGNLPAMVLEPATCGWGTVMDVLDEMVRRGICGEAGGRYYRLRESAPEEEALEDQFHAMYQALLN